MSVTISHLWYALLLIWASVLMGQRGIALDPATLPAGYARAWALAHAIFYLIVALWCLGYGCIQGARWIFAIVKDEF